MVGIDFLGEAVGELGVRAGCLVLIGIPMVSDPGGLRGDSGVIWAERSDRESDGGVWVDTGECTRRVGGPVVGRGRGEGGDGEDGVCELLGVY